MRGQLATSSASRYRRNEPIGEGDELGFGEGGQNFAPGRAFSLAKQRLLSKKTRKLLAWN